MRLIMSLGSVLVLIGVTLTSAGEPPAPPSVEIPKISPANAERSKSGTSPRTLESFQSSPLPTLEKKPTSGAKLPNAEPTSVDPSSMTGRTLPRTLPGASKSVSKRAPIVDPMVRTVSQEESLVPESTTTVPMASSAGATPATRGNVIRPTVEVRQITPPQVTPGTPSPIELTVINQGDSAVEKVILTDSLDSTLEVVSSNPRSEQSGNTLVWSLGRLEPKESKRVTFSVVARRQTGAPTALARASVTYTSAVESSMKLLTPDVAVHLSGPTKGMVGQPIDLSIELENKGNSPATGVLLRCALPPGLAHSEGPELEYEVGDLNPGESRSVPLTLTSSVAGESNIKVVIQADAVASIAAEHVLAIDDFQIGIDSEGPSQRYLNQTGAYKFRITNGGSASVTGVAVQVPLPEGLSFAYASDGGQAAGGTSVVRWNISDIAAGQTKEISLACVGAKIGDFHLEPEVLVGQRQVAVGKISTSIRGVAALSVEVADVADPVEVNGETIYEIHVVNQGTMAATGVVVTCTVPEEVEAVAADGPTSQRIVGQVLTFDPLAELAPHAEAIFRVKCKGLKEGNARFKATVSTDQLKTPVNEEESTTVYNGQ